jgi:mannan endo-1,4-beta-mannosidase
MNTPLALLSCLLLAAAGVSAGVAAGADLTFTIDAARDVHPISSLIYGYHQQAPRDTKQMDQLGGRMNIRCVRWGGNQTSAYNWEIDATHSGADHFHSNSDMNQDPAYKDMPAGVVKVILDGAKKYNMAALVTVPYFDYLAADGERGSGGRPSDWDVRKTPNYLSTRFVHNVAEKGRPFLLEPDLEDGFVYQDEFVNYLKHHYPDTKIIFTLGNEPAYWRMYPAINPRPATYDDVIEKHIRFALAIKKVWPDREITGMGSGNGMEVMMLENGNQLENSKTHQEIFPTEELRTRESEAFNTKRLIDRDKGPWVEYFLKKMREAEQLCGHRLIDYLDFHYYPSGEGYYSTTEKSLQLMLQQSRIFWDTTFVDNSRESRAFKGEAPQLIPRMRAIVNRCYPGTKLAITEWSMGSQDGRSVVAGIVHAETLGVFGREGLDIATFLAGGGHPMDENNRKTKYRIPAFLVFTNYDGRKSMFGDTSVQASTSDMKESSVFASIDKENPKRMVIVAINKKKEPRAVTISITHDAKYKSAEVWHLTEGTPQDALDAAAPIKATSPNRFAYEMPALSVSVIVPKP